LGGKKTKAAERDSPKIGGLVGTTEKTGKVGNSMKDESPSTSKNRESSAGESREGRRKKELGKNRWKRKNSDAIEKLQG